MSDDPKLTDEQEDSNRDPADGDPADTSDPADTGDPADASKPSRGKISAADKLKFTGLIVFFLLMIAGSVAGLLYINAIGTETLLVDLEQAIWDAGPFGVLICLLLQFIQIVVAFIPGEVVQLAIGWMYGTLWGGVITVAGALISSIFVFYLARKLGAPFVQGMIGSKDSKRMRFLRNSKNIDSLCFILYLIPGLPKDLFGYIFPLTDIKPSSFFVLSTIARCPAIFASTFVADSFKSGDYLQMAIVAVIFGGLGALGIIYNQKIMVLVDKLVTRISPRKHRKKGEG
ncbi:MAG: TVP38/TMEM64 family protein [Coriobacteriia bacterium]|nr:TVP38/TMEM64 family protein [Coriobacteriia bacterium]